MASIADRVGDLGDYLREQRENAQLSLRQLASLAGVSNPYLSQVERGLKKPSAEVLQQIARGLQISSEALYVRAGILDPTDSADLEQAIRADRLLTDRQKRVLVDIYSAFRAENGRAAADLAAEVAADLAVGVAVELAAATEKDPAAKDELAAADAELASPKSEPAAETPMASRPKATVRRRASKEI
jgi:transcriptional regulator with XRE-family HTH domain